MEQKTLLITGFEPFQQETINPSWEAVALLPETLQAEARATVKRAESIDVPAFTDAARNGDYANWQCSLLANGRLKIGGLSYQQLQISSVP